MALSLAPMEPLQATGTSSKTITFWRDGFSTFTPPDLPCPKCGSVLCPPPELYICTSCGTVLK